MTITNTQNGNTLTIALEGRLDTTTAPELEQEIKNIPTGSKSAKGWSRRSRTSCCRRLRHGRSVR